MKKILIIDDDLVVSYAYRNGLLAEGFQVECAHDGEAGLACLDRFQPDLVLLDLALPTVSGIQVLTRIRGTPATQSLPVVVLTNCYQPGLIEEARTLGATQCLHKSECTPKVAAETVGRILASSSPGPVSASLSTAAPPPSSLSVEELRRNFSSQARNAVGDFRRLLQSVVKETDPTRLLDTLAALHRAIHCLSGGASVCGFRTIAQLASALEALAHEIREQPKFLTPSVIRTLAQSIDFLGESIDSRIMAPGNSPKLPPNILVVDDDTTCREMLTFALTNAGINCISLGSPRVAMEVLEHNRFDLVFLDVNMPDVDGFEICKKIRQQPHNARCPVVFVTVAADFANRTRSTLSGGTDLIAKPFLPVELAAKSLIHLFGSKLSDTAGQSAPKAA